MPVSIFYTMLMLQRKGPLNANFRLSFLFPIVSKLWICLKSSKFVDNSINTTFIIFLQKEDSQSLSAHGSEMIQMFMFLEERTGTDTHCLPL